MSNPLHYKSNLRDLEFNLFEVLDVGATSLGREPFAGMTEETARETLRAFERFCTNELAPSFADTDRNPPVFKDGTVTLPEGLRKAMEAYYAGDWHRLGVAERLGGFGAPPSVMWAAFEMLAGANAALGFYIFGPFSAKVIDRHGTEDQKRRFVPNLLDRHWGGSMVLTEADAGSDVGAGRTRARHVEGDVWEIEGVKRFITNGEFDAAENIVHLVLARPEGGAAGTKGLSMFIVPKFWVDEDGRMGARNGVTCTNLEKKMGIKGSVTCELTFGDGAPARGLLVGGVHDGIKQMFAVIEQARMAVGIKSMATLSTAYLNALAYAKERVQGPDLLRATDKAAPRVRILEHPDVRRMLLLQKAHAEGMRALALYTAHMQDQVELQGGHGASEAAEADRLNDLLLPLVKGWCSDKGWEQLALSLQVFGGSGFLTDYPIEQYIRDQKIDSLYEGTTHIQSLDLVFRKVARDGGETLQGLFARIRETAEGQGASAVDELRKALARALGDVEGLFGALLQKFGESAYHVGLQGNRTLLALAELVAGWLLVRHAEVAEGKLAAAAGAERAFYEGKLASARTFCREVFPALTLARKQVEASRLDAMDVPEDAF